jgi:hypothetical protein
MSIGAAVALSLVLSELGVASVVVVTAALVMVAFAFGGKAEISQGWRQSRRR